MPDSVCDVKLLKKSIEKNQEIIKAADRKIEQKFEEWIGLKKIEGGKKTLTAIIMASIAFLCLGALTFYTIKGIETATSEF